MIIGCGGNGQLDGRLARAAALHWILRAVSSPCNAITIAVTSSCATTGKFTGFVCQTDDIGLRTLI